MGWGVYMINLELKDVAILTKDNELLKLVPDAYLVVCDADSNVCAIKSLTETVTVDTSIYKVIEINVGEGETGV